MLNEAAASSKGLVLCDVNGIYKIQTDLMIKAMPFNSTNFMYTTWIQYFLCFYLLEMYINGLFSFVLIYMWFKPNKSEIVG